MPGGRPPKPTSLKLLQGNPGKRPLPANEPKPPTGKAIAPRWLCGKGKAAWRRLAPMLSGMRVLSKADAEKLALGCDALGEYLELRETIQELGHIYETVTVTGSTVIRPRPEVAMAADAWKRASAILSEFGLSPSARARVQTIIDEQEDPFETFLRGKQSSG